MCSTLRVGILTVQVCIYFLCCSGPLQELLYNTLKIGQNKSILRFFIYISTTGLAVYTHKYTVSEYTCHSNVFHIPGIHSCSPTTAKTAMCKSSTPLHNSFVFVSIKASTDTIDTHEHFTARPSKTINHLSRQVCTCYRAHRCYYSRLPKYAVSSKIPYFRTHHTPQARSGPAPRTLT